MSPAQWVGVIAIVVIVALVLAYLVPRLVSAGWHRSRVEAEQLHKE